MLDKFNNAFNAIMESINTYDDFKFRAAAIGYNFIKRNVPVEVTEQIVEEAIEMQRKIFEEHLASGEELSRMLYWYLSKDGKWWNCDDIDNGKVVSIEGDTVTITGINDDTGNEVNATFDIKTGNYFPREVQNFLVDKRNEYTEQRKANAEKAQCDKEENERNLVLKAEKSPEYKAFTDELSEKFSTELSKWYYDGVRSDEVIEFIKAQPEEIREMFVVKSEHAARYNSPDEHLEGLAYDQDRREKSAQSSALYAMAREIKATL